MNKIVYSPKALNGILDTIDMLQAQAEIGKPLYFSSDMFSGYRFLVYKNYLAFYRTSADTIYIDRIIYGKRDYMRLLFRDLD